MKKMELLVESIITNLGNNGYPQKRVSFPTEKMYEVADNKGLSFNKVLEHLKAEHKIDNEIQTEKVIFFPVEEAQETSQDEMMKKAQEMMSQMSPEELSNIQKMFENMSDEEKQNMMDQAKKMGL